MIARSVARIGRLKTSWSGMSKAMKLSVALITFGLAATTSAAAQSPLRHGAHHQSQQQEARRRYLQRRPQRDGENKSQISDIQDTLKDDYEASRPINVLETTSPSSSPTSSAPPISETTSSDCIIEWSDYITCTFDNYSNCLSCDQSSSGIAAGEHCDGFEAWWSVNDKCCVNDECGELLNIFQLCVDCIALVSTFSASPSKQPATSSPTFSASSTPSSVPSHVPSLSPMNIENGINVPTIGPSASPVPSLSVSDSPSRIPSTVPSHAASLSPTNIENGINVPTIGPSASLAPSLSVSDSPSRIPSTVPSLEPSLMPTGSGVNAGEVPTLGPSVSLAPSSFSLSGSPSQSPSEEPP